MTTPVFCDSCGARFHAGKLTCQKCGNPAAPATGATSADEREGYCDACGAGFGADSMFCIRCSAKLSRQVAAPAVENSVLGSAQPTALPAATQPRVPHNPPSPSSKRDGARRDSKVGRGIALALLLVICFAFGSYWALRQMNEKTRPAAETPRVPGRVAPDLPHSPERPELTNQDKIALLDYATGASVIVIADDPDATTAAMGTGFVVKRFAYRAVVATNRHVVLGQSSRPHARFKVVTSSGYEHDALLLFFDSDPAFDFALLSVRDDQQQLGQPATIGRLPAVGDPVICVGSPVRPRLIATVGRATEVDAEDGLFAADCLGEHGSSGGPVFASDNSVIGIQTWGIGFENRGGAQMAGRLLPDYWGRRLDVWQMTVNARGDWQDSNIPVAAGAEVRLLALNKWTCGPLCGSVTAYGVNGYAEYAYYPGCRTAGLLVNVSGENAVYCVDKQWAGGMDPTGVVQQILAGQRGTLRFRMNDRDQGNNSGSIDVLAAVRGASP